MENVNQMTPAELKAFEKAQRKENRIPGMFEIIAREVWRDKFAFACLLIIIAAFATVYIWGHIMEQDPYFGRVRLGTQNLPPSVYGGLGTDGGGRSMLVQLVLGARNSLTIAFIVTLASSLIGYVVGIIAGYFGGFVDWIIMRSIEIITLIPTIMLIIVLTAVIPNYDTPHFIAILVFTGWFGTTITFRARVLQESAKDYVAASKTLGTPNWKIMFKKILPNVTSFLMVGLVLGLAGSIGLETGLTVIGRGLPFRTPSLGVIIANAMDPIVLRTRLWQWVPAVIFIVTMTLAINGLGRAVARAVNPKKRR